jgi:hypothetical protein
VRLAFGFVLAATRPLAFFVDPFFEPICVPALPE